MLSLRTMDTRNERFLRLPEILGNPRANPPIRPLIPIGKSAWWAGVKSGRFPQPVKLGPRMTCWREVDIARLLNQQPGGGGE